MISAILFIVLQKGMRKNLIFWGCWHFFSFLGPSEIYGENDEKLTLLLICCCSGFININKKSAQCSCKKHVFCMLHTSDSLQKLLFECIWLFVLCASIVSFGDFIISLLTGFEICFCFDFL